MVEDLHDIRSFESVGICDEFAEFLEIVGVFVPGQRGEIFERLDAMLQREAGNEAGHFVEEDAQGENVVCRAGVGVHEPGERRSGRIVVDIHHGLDAFTHVRFLTFRRCPQS